MTRFAHSIVILTSDVHYGRIAQCTLTSGRGLIEVNCSPMWLVDKKAEGAWEGAPNFFPSLLLPGVKMPGAVRAQMQTLEKKTFPPIDTHFLGLEFSATGTHVRMIVRLWPVRR